MFKTNELLNKLGKNGFGASLYAVRHKTHLLGTIIPSSWIVYRKNEDGSNGVVVADVLKYGLFRDPVISIYDTATDEEYYKITGIYKGVVENPKIKGDSHCWPSKYPKKEDLQFSS